MGQNGMNDQAGGSEESGKGRDSEDLEIDGIIH